MARGKGKHFAGKDRGNAAVEMAVIAPVPVFMALGAFVRRPESAHIVFRPGARRAGKLHGGKIHPEMDDGKDISKGWCEAPKVGGL